MRIEQFRYPLAGGDATLPAALGVRASLVLLFGSPERVSDAAIFGRLRAAYPSALLAGCSTAGEILGTTVSDQSLVVTAIAFDAVQVRGVGVDIRVGEPAADAAARLAAGLPADGLRHVLVFSDGLEINGSAFTAGLAAALPGTVAVTGGLAADGLHFSRTLVALDAPAAEGRVAAVGFYGDRLRLAHGCFAGWDAFGPDRLVTRAERNVLFELDGQPALALYKRYLGEQAKRLPAAGLLFPLEIRTGADDVGVVRSILAVDERNGSMTFAGAIPAGATARLMRASISRLIGGATRAAEQARDMVDFPGGLALLVSCLGRKLVLRQRTEEEVEAVHRVLGPQVALSGFYSYGEIAPAAPGERSAFHNQTMTITLLDEA